MECCIKSSSEKSRYSEIAKNLVLEAKSLININEVLMLNVRKAGAAVIGYYDVAGNDSDFTIGTAKH